ncbi:MAG TPA: Na+/H+ antiporter NhaA, partial [Arachidicoccus soli]|nr:Na+/H+ antiporter NhaA [Arachidicoccus soli]
GILHFINDGLMAVFFFMAGMEIKRELVGGELSSPQQALLPTIAAVSGVVVPTIIFLLFNKGTDFAHGWGIPTATDIAFSLGIAALLGKRVPMSLRVFLTALAIIDDLCAIFIIALFYGANVHGLWLLGVAIFILLIILLNKIKKPKLEFLRFLFGLALWFCMFHSGIHATVAGVIFAFLVPVELLNVYENKIHVFVNFFIIPIFALANTAILLKISLADFMQSTLSWGIILGLLIGKPLGILASCYFMVKRKWAVLPAGSSWHQFIGVAMLAGIGFTMSIFVSSLAFDDIGAQDIAKIAIILASFIAMLLGFVWLRMTSKTASES